MRFAFRALADIGPPEFTPGVPWKGFRNIDPEADPNITPGSVAISKTMSLNTVNADQVSTRKHCSTANMWFRLPRYCSSALLHLNGLLFE